MNKNRRRAIALFVLAAILSCMAGCFALSFLQSANDEVAQTKRQYGEQVNVIVVAKDVPARAALTLASLLDGTLKVEKRPRLFTPESAFVIPDAADANAIIAHLGNRLDGYTLIPLKKGDILLPSMIETSFVIPPNLRAVSLAVSNVTSVSGYVRSGDKVDVIASYELEESGGAGGGKKYQRTIVLLQNATVLSVSWVNNLGTSSQIAPTTGLTATILYGQGQSQLGALQSGEKRDTVVTLAVSLEEAAKLSFMEVFGKEVRLVLRRLDDTKVAPVPTVAPEQYK
jgi:pilus assembly protein CpaB